MQNNKILAITALILLASCTQQHYSDRTKYNAEHAAKKEHTKHNYNIPGATEMSKPIHIPTPVTIPVTH
ncbi:MAG: hypothetical protein H6909_00990 [Rickettsiaceae bacterium]|nr:hypothetical protein [Rickettsiaceae bacterium]